MSRQWLSLISCILFAILCTTSSALNNAEVISSLPFNYEELTTIKNHLLANIATVDHVIEKQQDGMTLHSIPGAVIASPSNVNATFSQDYVFHWVRDAAITMKEVTYLYEHTDKEKKYFKTYLFNYINFESKAQKQTSREGEETLGQPKFNLDATIWEGEWGRPQNDGPALRAITMLAIANAFMQEGNETYVREIMLPIITTDLDYVVSHWQAKHFDIWEEVNDEDHFFTKMVQRKSLLAGASLLTNLNDHERANLYGVTAQQLGESLEKHWNESRGYLTETVNQQYYKGGGINSAILLGVLYGDLSDGNIPFAINDDRVMSTIYYMRNAFATLYRVNVDNKYAPPMMGRYANDIYDGDKFVYGNPWILTTNALAQYYYALVNIYLIAGEINITQRNLLFFKQVDPDAKFEVGVISLERQSEKFYRIILHLLAEGDHALKTVKKYSSCYNDSDCYHLAEQIDRTSAKPTSAQDLTWNYSSLLSAMQTRLLTDNLFRGLKHV